MSSRLRTHPVYFVSALWIAPAIFAMVNHVAQRRLYGRPSGSVQDLIFEGADWFLYAFITPVVFWTSTRWPVVRPVIARRLVIHATLALSFCVVWAVSGKLMQGALVALFEPARLQSELAAGDRSSLERIARDVLGWIFTTLPFGIVVYASMAGVAHAFRYFGESRDRAVQVAKLSEQLADARLSALQAQLNPHFLFNTLNTIAVRARDGDGSGTAQLVEQLSDMLRRTLSHHRTSLVTLGEELALVKQYLSIEEARYSDRLRCTIDVDASLNGAAVPGFAIQHLVENAVRHGIARRNDAGALTMNAEHVGDSLVITVRDDGAGIEPHLAFPAGHGLANTEERLRVIYGDRATLTVEPYHPCGTTATLSLPWQQLSQAALADYPPSNG